MIAARKASFFNFALRRWLAVILRRRFHNIYLLGVDNLRGLDATRPVVGCVNHTNWWDGFVLYVFSHRRLPHDIYLAMEEKNLKHYQFFTWMGVFGLDLSNPRTVLPGLRYAVNLLRLAGRAPRLIWIFVQGQLFDPRMPIDSKPGAGFIAKHTGAQILPLVLRYEWLLESRPSIFVQIGAPMPPETSSDALAATLNDLFARIDTMLGSTRLAACDSLFPPRMSMNKRWEYFVHWLMRRSEVFDQQNH